MAMELFQIFGRIALNGVEDVNDDLNETTRNAHSSSNKMVSAFKKIGAAIGAYFAVDKIKDFGKACVAAAADVAAEEAAFEQIMGTYAGSAQNKLDAVANATGITNTRLTGYMTSLGWRIFRYLPSMPVCSSSTATVPCVAKISGLIIVISFSVPLLTILKMIIACGASSSKSWGVAYNCLGLLRK